jgi:hypothetical protein
MALSPGLEAKARRMVYPGGMQCRLGRALGALAGLTFVVACGDPFTTKTNDDNSGGSTSGGSEGDGGSNSSGGTNGTGATGNVPGTGGGIGDGGSGGTATGGTGGTSVGGTGGAPSTTPLAIADVTDIDTVALSSFNIGFRCKSLTLCTAAQSCIYYQENLGFVQSVDVYSDGVELTESAPVKVNIDVGSDSTCGNPSISIAAGHSITVTHDGGQTRAIYFPTFEGTRLTLYVASDGSTYYDAALTQLAQPSATISR